MKLVKSIRGNSHHFNNSKDKISDYVSETFSWTTLWSINHIFYFLPPIVTTSESVVVVVVTDDIVVCFTVLFDVVFVSVYAKRKFHEKCKSILWGVFFSQKHYAHLTEKTV